MMKYYSILFAILANTITLVYLNPASPFHLLGAPSINQKQGQQSSINTHFNLNQFTGEKIGYKDFIARKKYFAENIQGMESLFDNPTSHLKTHEKQSQSNDYIAYEHKINEDSHKDHNDYTITNTKLKHSDSHGDASDAVLHLDVTENTKFEKMNDKQNPNDGTTTTIVNDPIDDADENKYTGESLIGSLNTHENINEHIKYHYNIERPSRNLPVNSKLNDHAVDDYKNHNSDTTTIHLDNNADINQDEQPHSENNTQDKNHIITTDNVNKYEHTTLDEGQLHDENSERIIPKIKNNEHSVPTIKKHTNHDRNMYNDNHYKRSENHQGNTNTIENIISKLYKSFEGWLL